MGKFFDFVKRRIVGYAVSWSLALVFLAIVYHGDPPATAGGLVIFGIAFAISLLYTRRMKRIQRARREEQERTRQWQAWYQAQQARDAQQRQQWLRAQQALLAQAQQAREKTLVRPPGPP